MLEFEIFEKYQGAKGIISDIHSSDVALDYALNCIGSRGIIHISCLGDILGYGTQPSTLINRFREGWISTDGNIYPFQTSRGNHEDHIIDLYRGRASPGTLLGLYDLNPDAVKTMAEAAEVLKKSAANEKRNIGFLENLPERIRIMEGVYGSHAVKNKIRKIPVYTIPAELGEQYGIHNLDIMIDPRLVFDDPEYFDEKTIANIFGHTHIPFACGIDENRRYDVLVPHGMIKLIIEARKKKNEQRKEDDLASFFGDDEDNEEEDDVNYIEMKGGITEFDLKKYKKSIISVGSVSRSKSEDLELFNENNKTHSKRGKIFRELEEKGACLSTVFFGILRKDYVFEFHSLFYEKML